MEIKHEHGRFYIDDNNGETIAHITYQHENDATLIANSTFVDPSLRGQGIAQKLLDKLVGYARENNLKIRPLCSYVVKAFDQSDAYDDVAAK